MKRDFRNAKGLTLVIFSIFSPLIFVGLTIYMMNSFGVSSSNDGIAAIILVALMTAPYILLLIFKQHNWAMFYIIIEYIWLIIFTVYGRYFNQAFVFGFEVWGLAFIAINMIDRIVKLIEIERGK